MLTRGIMLSILHANIPGYDLCVLRSGDFPERCMIICMIDEALIEAFRTEFD